MALHDVDARITELEVKLSFADDLLETLNRTVYRQQQEIEQLRQELRALRQQLQASIPAEPRNLRRDSAALLTGLQAARGLALMACRREKRMDRPPQAMHHRNALSMRVFGHIVSGLCGG